MLGAMGSASCQTVYQWQCTVRHHASVVQQTCLPSEEEQLGARFTGAADVAVAVHQLFHTLRIQTCTTSSAVEHQLCNGDCGAGGRCGVGADRWPGWGWGGGGGGRWMARLGEEGGRGGLEKGRVGEGGQGRA